MSRPTGPFRTDHGLPDRVNLKPGAAMELFRGNPATITLAEDGASWEIRIVDDIGEVITWHAGPGPLTLADIGE